MTIRKRWRLRLYPRFTYQTMPSMKKAYEAVQRYRERYALGMSTLHQVDIEVNEGDGWRLYERLVFPVPASA